MRPTSNLALDQSACALAAARRRFEGVSQVEFAMTWPTTKIHAARQTGSGGPPG